MALTDQQIFFVDAYFQHNFNAVRAAAAAGYADPRANASKVKKNKFVAAEIKRRLEENALGANEVLSLLADHARGVAADVLRVERVVVKGEDGTEKEGRAVIGIDWEKAEETGALKLIKSFGYDSNGLPKFEMYDAQNALMLLGKNHKLFTDKVEHSGDPDKPVTVMVIRGVSMDDV